MPLAPTLALSGNADLPLLLAAALLAVLATALTAAGRRRAGCRGFGWWSAALWTAAAGCALGAALDGPLGDLACAALLLPWPVLTVVGLRRFNARHAMPASERADWALLAAVAAVQVAGVLALGPGDERHAALSAGCALAVHLYAAALLLRGSGREAAPLQGLGAALALAAFAPWATALLDPVTAGAGHLLPWQALADSLAAVVMAIAVLTLAAERSERQLRQSRQRLRVLAHLDPLTQVPNRRRFAELAGRALQLDRPGGTVLLLLDIDHFKRINDELGHATGDQALCLVAGSLLEQLRAQDVAGRHGGDEFVLLLRGASVREAMGVAGRIVTQVQCRAAEQRMPRLSLSFGMVQVATGEGLDDALRRADQALYQAKRQGRSCAVAAAGDEQQPVFSESRRLGLTPS